MSRLPVIVILCCVTARVGSQNTSFPSSVPSLVHSDSPTISVISFPTSRPTLSDITSPSALPSVAPASSITEAPFSSLTPNSSFPSLQPISLLPSASPTPLPSIIPTLSPTSAPTLGLTSSPTLRPTIDPSSRPTPIPTEIPSAFPSTSLLPTLPALCSVAHEDWIGNGLCDVEGGYNTEQCDYDGGDCCQSTRTALVNASTLDNSGTLSYDFCADPSILRKASFQFAMGNVSKGAVEDLTLLHELISETLSEVLNVSDALLFVTATASPLTLGVLTAAVNVSFEAPLVTNSRVVAGLTSEQLLVVLQNATQSGAMERAMRVEAVFLDMSGYLWVRLCLNSTQCQSTPQQQPSETTHSGVCSFQSEQWSRFYGWSHSFPKYLLWLTALLLLKLGFTLYTAASYWQERHFLSSRRITQYLLSVIIGLCSVTYLLIEMLAPTLRSGGPSTFACLEFSFRETESDYTHACTSDFYFANPFLISSQLMVYALVCIAVNCRLEQKEEQYREVSALRSSRDSCSLVLLLLHQWTRVSTTLLLVYLVAVVVMLLIYLSNSSVGVYSTVPIGRLAVGSQVAVGCHVIVSMVYSLWMTGTDDLMRRIHRGEEGRQVESSALAGDSLSDLTSNENNFEKNQEEKQEDSEAQIEVEVEVEVDANQLEHVGSVGEFPPPKAGQSTASTRVPAHDEIWLHLIMLCYAVLLVSTATVKLKEHFWFAAIGYSLLLRTCEVLVVFLLSKSQ